jgi:hypothetical protein
MGSPGLSWVLLGSPGLSWAPLGSPCFSWASLAGSPELSSAFLGSPGLWALPGLSWALLGSTGLSWALLGSCGLLGPGLSWALRALLGSAGLSWAPFEIAQMPRSPRICPQNLQSKVVSKKANGPGVPYIATKYAIECRFEVSRTPWSPLYSDKICNPRSFQSNTNAPTSHVQRQNLQSKVVSK